TASCGRRTASPITATTTKATQRIQRDWVAFVSIRSLPRRLDSGRLAPHLDLDIVVQFVSCVSVAVEANIAAFHALGVNQLALVRLDVVHVLSCAEAELALEVVVED